MKKWAVNVEYFSHDHVVSSLSLIRLNNYSANKRVNNVIVINYY